MRERESYFSYKKRENGIQVIAQLPLNSKRSHYSCACSVCHQLFCRWKASWLEKCIVAPFFPHARTLPAVGAAGGWGSDIFLWTNSLLSLAFFPPLAVAGVYQLRISFQCRGFLFVRPFHFQMRLEEEEDGPAAAFGDASDSKTVF